MKNNRELVDKHDAIEAVCSKIMIACNLPCTASYEIAEDALKRLTTYKLIITYDGEKNE